MPLAYPCDTTQPEVPQGHYGRLCRCHAGEWPGYDPVSLHELAMGMQDSAAKRNARADAAEGRSTMPSGYVYFGQFIDHDVTKDNIAPEKATPAVEEVRNYRTARFDLESVYGRVPAEVPCLYEADGERLKLAQTLPAEDRNGQIIAAAFDDLPRDQGVAKLIDARNDENLIIAQLHVLFAKFHNRALEVIRANPTLAPGNSLLERTRRFVIWHYQWLIINDFLPRIARRAVLDEISRLDSAPRVYPRWLTPADAPFSLPVEFTVAAFRFGHSAVRSAYELNDHLGGVRASEIIRMTKRGGGIVSQLPANYVIAWEKFFYGSPAELNRAERIDANISEMLYDLPKASEDSYRFQSQFKSFALPPPHVKMMPLLPEATLIRASNIRLASGEEFAARFGFDVIDPAALFPARKAFFESDLGARTPLWYYLLCEADLESNPEPPVAGLQQQKLGTMGSYIVAETLYQLLRADEDSILNIAAEKPWEPGVFLDSAGQRRSIRSMSELAMFASGD